MRTQKTATATSITTKTAPPSTRTPRPPSNRYRRATSSARSPPPHDLHTRSEKTQQHKNEREFKTKREP